MTGATATLLPVEDIGRPLSIAGVSDVSVGYGSPQILCFMNSLSKYYGVSGATLIEPDQPEKAPLQKSKGVYIRRIYSGFYPYTGPGRVDYIMKSAVEIQKLRPDILVIFCTYSLPVLFKLSYRPEFVIYYSLEFTSSYGSFDVELNRHLEELVDLIIYPEDNRARRDIELCGYKDIPTVVLYNCVNKDSEIVAWPADQRNGRILYAGTISRELTLADYYLDSRLRDVPIDLFGTISGSEEQATREAFAKLIANIRYLGFVDSKVLTDLRKKYSYSIVMWNPINDNFLYAAPNKLFESIADHVPPIVAPHPQCKEIVQHYDCGIIMDDWGFDAFNRALREAIALFGTPRYYEMVNNCRKAVVSELNWGAQFEKAKKHLKVFPLES